MSSDVEPMLEGWGTDDKCAELAMIRFLTI